MEKWYVVDDGGVYNVFPESDLKQYGIERGQIVKVTTNMDTAFNYAEKLNRDTEEKSPNFAPSKGYYEKDANKGMYPSFGMKYESKEKKNSIKHHINENETFKVMFDAGEGKEDFLVCGGFKSFKEAQNFIETRKRPEHYYVGWDGIDESKNSKKITLTESRLNQIISESIKRAILKEGFFDSFPSMYEKEEKKDDDSSKEKGENKASAKRRERVISRLKSDGVDVAQYAYRLWPDKDEDSARSYFYKCLDSKTNDTGDVYKFTSDEINRLYSMLSNDEL